LSAFAKRALSPSLPPSLPPSVPLSLSVHQSVSSSLRFVCSFVRFFSHSIPCHPTPSHSAFVRPSTTSLMPADLYAVCVRRRVERLRVRDVVIHDPLCPKRTRACSFTVRHGLRSPHCSCTREPSACTTAKTTILDRCSERNLVHAPNTHTRVRGTTRKMPKFLLDIVW